MTRPNGHSDNGNTQVLQETDGTKILNSVPVPPLAALPEFATGAKQRTKKQVQQNRFVIIGAGAVVTALLIFVAMSMPHRGGAEKTKNRGAISKDESTVDTSTESNERCLFPITDSGRPAARESRKGFLNERDLQRLRFVRYRMLRRQNRRMGGDAGFDTTVWRADMASTALQSGFEC